MPTDKSLTITWMCTACGEFGVLLRGPSVLCTEVTAAVTRDHKKVAPQCKADVVFSSEEVPACRLPAKLGPKPPRTVIETLLSHWQLPAALLVLVPLATLIEWWCNERGGRRQLAPKHTENRRLWRIAGLGGICRGTRRLPAHPVAPVRQGGPF